MKKRIVTLILEILSIYAFSQNALKVQKLYYFEPKSILYIEASYELDEDIYVSDELNSGISCFSLDGNCLNVIYYPRGNKIQSADESTFWPVPVRKISNGDILTFRCNLNDVIRYGNPFDLEFITEVKFIIEEVCFRNNGHIKRNKLYPQAYATKFNIRCEEILFKKNESNYEVLTDFPKKTDS